MTGNLFTNIDFWIVAISVGLFFWLYTRQKREKISSPDFEKNFKEIYNREQMLFSRITVLEQRAAEQAQIIKNQYEVIKSQTLTITVLMERLKSHGHEVDDIPMPKEMARNQLNITVKANDSSSVSIGDSVMGDKKTAGEDINSTDIGGDQNVRGNYGL